MSLAYDLLRELLLYDPILGEFRWRYNSRIAGCVDVDRNGHRRRRIKISGTSYKASNLAWLYMTTEWPALEIDHINRQGDDDCWENLREATQAEQCVNRRNWGKYPRGVSAYQQGFMARITRGGTTRYLGTFTTAEAAADAYATAAKEYGYDT